MRPRRAEVTILTQLFYPELVSTGQTLTELAEQLTELGMSVRVISGPATVDRSLGALPRTLVHKGIAVERVPGTRLPKLWLPGRVANAVTFAAFAAARVLLSRERSPLLVFTNPPFLAGAALLARLVRKRPFIYVVFDLYPAISVAAGVMRQGSLLHRAWRRFNRALYANASAIVVLGECMKRLVVDEAVLNRNDLQRVQVVHVWADDRLVQATSGTATEYRREWGLTGKLVLLYSGNMGRIHDMETIMGAAKALASHDDIQFVFVGEGHKRRWMEQYVADHGLSNCAFRGYVPRERLPELLATADASLVTLASEFTGMAVPSKLYAVMASGRPALYVGDGDGEAARVIREARCGLVVPCGSPERLAEAVLYLKAHPDVATEMGRRGRAAIDERYSLRAAAEAYRDLITSIHESSTGEPLNAAAQPTTDLGPAPE